MNTNHVAGTILSVSAYLTIASFSATVCLKTAALLKASGTTMAGRGKPGAVSRTSSRAVLKWAGDIFFFTRLLRTNDVLWLGEWLFHCSFLFVVMRHLRYVVEPIPGCIVFAQPAGIIAGFLLPAALLYILAVKWAVERTYAPLYNLFLIMLLLALSVTGVLMRTAARPDIVDVKVFVLGLVHFSPQALPGSFLFALHFMLFLLLVLYLPTHVVAAPLIMLDARKREEELKQLMH
jgi:nitrate reductase gamma subunit